MAMLVFCYTPAERTINQTKHFPDPTGKHLIHILNSTYPLKRDKEAEDTNRVWITRKCLQKRRAEDVQHRCLHIAGSNCYPRPEALSRRDAGRRAGQSALHRPARCRTPSWQSPAALRGAVLPSGGSGSGPRGQRGARRGAGTPRHGTAAPLTSLCHRVKRLRGVLARARGGTRWSLRSLCSPNRSVPFSFIFSLSFP